MDDHHHDESRSYWIQKEGGRISCLMNNSHGAAAHVFGGDSWEEQAFAEDAAVGGGCVWPPRSYTCSFCRREFRSAQALGGHMNVHRRDRAKLKQINISGNSTSNSNNKNQILLENSAAAANYTTSSSFDDRSSTHHHHVSLLQNNPNNTSFDLDPHHNALFSSTSSTIRPYSSTASILHPFTCNSFGQQQQHKSCTPPILMSWPTKFEPRKRFHIEDLGNQDADCITKVIESNSTNSKKNININHEIHFTAGNLSSSSSLVRKRSSFQYHDEEEAEDGLMFMKKRRVLIDDDGGSDGQYYLFPKNSNLQVINDDDEVIEPPAVEVHHERSPNSTLECLDLELRLGDKP